MSRMSTTRWVTFIGALVALGVVFFLGLFAGASLMDGRRGYVGEDGQKRFLEEEAALAIESLSGNPPVSAEAASEAYAAQLAEALAALQAVKDPLEREYKAGLIAQSLSQQTLLAVLPKIEAQPRGSGRDVVLGALLERWGELDARSALSYARSPRAPISHNSALVAVLRGWASSSPQSAWQWVQENGGSRHTQADRVSAVLLSIARTDRNRAFDLALSADPDVRPAAVTALIFGLLDRTTPAEAASWLESIPAGEAKTEATRYLASQWAYSEPEAAAAWAQTVMGAAEDAAVGAVAEGWAQLDPQSAARWVSTLPGGPARESAASGLATAWLDAQNGAGELANWINSQEPSSDFDGAVRLLADDIARYDAANALSWAAAIQSPVQRSAAVQAIGFQWLAENPDAAAAGISAANIDPAMKRALLGSSSYDGSVAASGAGDAAQQAPQSTAAAQQQPGAQAQPGTAAQQGTASQQPAEVVEEVIIEQAPIYVDEQGNYYTDPNDYSSRIEDPNALLGPQETVIEEVVPLEE